MAPVLPVVAEGDCIGRSEESPAAFVVLSRDTLLRVRAACSDEEKADLHSTLVQVDAAPRQGTCLLTDRREVASIGMSAVPEPATWEQLKARLRSN